MWDGEIPANVSDSQEYWIRSIVSWEQFVLRTLRFGAGVGTPYGFRTVAASNRRCSIEARVSVSRASVREVDQTNFGA